MPSLPRCLCRDGEGDCTNVASAAYPDHLPDQVCDDCAHGDHGAHEGADVLTPERVVEALDTLRELRGSVPFDLMVTGGRRVWEGMIEGQRCSEAAGRYLFGDDEMREALDG